LEAERRCGGSEFQTVGAATWKLHVAAPTFKGYFTVHLKEKAKYLTDGPHSASWTGLEWKSVIIPNTTIPSSN